MSFDNSSSFAQWQSSLNSSSDKQSQPRQRGQAPSVWGQPSSTKRGLTPLATSNLTSGSSPSSKKQAHNSDSDAVNQTTSPSNTNFPPLTAAPTTRFGHPRATPPGSSHSNSPITILQAGAHQSQAYQSTRLATSPRSRTNTPSQSSNIPTGNALTYSGLGPGGGGGLSAGTASGTQSPPLVNQNIGSPTSFSFERSTIISSNPSSSTGQSSLSKISATQVLLLLDTITEKEGQAKWDAKADKIRKLLDSNGMEVFAQFFRRVVTQNAAAIFSGAKGLDEGSHKLLRQELDKVPQNPDQANKIAEVVDSTKDEPFRDFDLITFTQHFYDDPLPQALLAIAFTRCVKQDLRTKADKLLSTLSPSLIHSISQVQESSTRLSTRSIVVLIEYFALSGRLSTHEQKYEFYWAVGQRYENSNPPPPTEVMAALQLLRLPDQGQELARVMLKNGAKATSSKQAAEELLSQVGMDLNAAPQIATALLFATFSPQNFNMQNLVLAAKQKISPRTLDWDAVIQSFDIAGLRIRAEDFLRLFNALSLVASDSSPFDIQKLWGGNWQNVSTQVSFLKGFFATSSEDVVAIKIPRFRFGFTMSDFISLPDELKWPIETSLATHFSSEDAMQAVFEVILGTEGLSDDAERLELLADIYQHHSTPFLLSLPKVAAKPWLPDQEKFVAECFSVALAKQRPESIAILQALSLRDTQFVFDLCTSVFQLDPRQTEVIYERAQDFGWTEEFLRHWSNPLALDIACMHDKLQADFDLDRYLSDAAESQSNLGVILFKYLRIKADDEFRVQRDQSQPQSVPLGLGTVHTLLEKLEDHLDDRELVKGAQTTCLQTYPRLMNYGAGFDEILQASSDTKGNKLPEEIDKQMSTLFGRMYRSELSIRDMINEMKMYKTSSDPAKQDLFCCIVHGLFDEYVCYSEYPEDALEKTALLFGSIIKYKLLPAIPRDFGLALVLEAVRDHPADSLMHRFGVEALLQISDQLAEWPGLCSLLLQVPTLQNAEILQKAQEGLQTQQTATSGSAATVIGENATTTSEKADAMKSEVTKSFRSLTSETASADGRFADPEQQVQEKILFVVNNLSQENMSGKIAELKKALNREHFEWFASYLVDQRARLEPNNQEMYFQSLELLDDKMLMAEVIRETFVSIVKMMNAESTANSATERIHLKNLGGWLGTITLAQDKPIKHKNIYFVDLLIEAYDTQRLVVVIPFTCKVLAQGARSMIFKPPNPWLMEIIHLLKELYVIADLKLNLKFEIEVLYKDLKLDFKKVEPSTIIRDRPQHDDDMTNLSRLPDGLDPLDEISSLNGAINRGVRERLTAVEIMATLPNLEDVLKYPPTSGSPVDQALVKSIIYRAFDQAIQEIIAPVVERSITIASISTAQLISKDYAFESDPEKYRAAARQMVKSLAGSLALVTCKEPLRMSITNYIRRPNDDLPEHLLPEGAILMCVNDNLDTACSFVEQAAELRAIPEIDHVIEPDLEERRRYQSEGGDRGFVGGNVNQWSTWIPEPYKQTVGGLKDAQRAVYEEFDRRVHGVGSNHIQSASADSSGRQLPDILQDALAMPNLSTPAGQPALPHQSPMVQQEPRSLSALQQPRMNGFADSMTPHERMYILIEEIQKAARNSPANRLRDLEKNSPIFQDSRQVLIVLTSSTRPAVDLLARQVAEKICNVFVTNPPQSLLESEILAFLLSKLCQLSEQIIRDVVRWISANEELMLRNTRVIASLVLVGLWDLVRVDNAIAASLHARDMNGLQLLADFLDQTLFTEEPIALRADFANSLIEMCMWIQEKPDLHLATEINRRLRAHGMPEFVAVAITDKSKARQDQMRYVFDEWVGIFENVDAQDSTFAAFLKELHQNQLINSSEELAEFLRIAIDSCCECFEKEAQSPRGSLFSAFLNTDALARLVVLLLRFQGNLEGAVKMSKAPYLDSILSTVVLVMNHHQVMHGVHFNQRVFGRLLNSILYEYESYKLYESPEHGAMMLVVAKILRSLTPAWFPGFVFAWNGLIMNRVFVGGMLGHASTASVEAYRELIGLAILYPAELQKTLNFENISSDLYKGLFRNILVLYRDFPDFICENYGYFCARIPFYAPQLRNVILTSRPSSSRELTDPTQIQGRIDQLEDMDTPPVLASDYLQPLEQSDMFKDVQKALDSNTKSDDAIDLLRSQIEELPSESSTSHPSQLAEILAALVPFVANVTSLKNAGQFDEDSSQVTLFTKLAVSFEPKHRYFLLNAVADQIRYPSSQTSFFLKLMLYLWELGHTDIRETIARIVYERLVVARPQPWAMVLLFVELQQKGAQEYWGPLGSDGNGPSRHQQVLRGFH